MKPDSTTFQAPESSTLAAGAYDAASRTLELEFRDGSAYRYAGVPAGTFEALAAAPSKGRYFNAAIRDRFPSRKVLPALSNARSLS
jgi:hypothetical protein